MRPAGLKPATSGVTGLSEKATGGSHGQWITDRLSLVPGAKVPAVRTAALGYPGGWLATVDPSDLVGRMREVGRQAVPDGSNSPVFYEEAQCGSWRLNLSSNRVTSILISRFALEALAIRRKQSFSQRTPL